MKIGVIADTHLPEKRPALPPRVLEIFASVEIILHAGDITSMKVLQQLQEEVSQTFAVYGDRDAPLVKSYLRPSQVLEVGNRRIGLIHGDRSAPSEWRAHLRRLIRRPEYNSEFLGYLQDRFGEVDAIVFGHTHVPFSKTYNGVFFFNPGSLTPRTGPPTIGLLEIDSRGIRGRILPV